MSEGIRVGASITARQFNEILQLVGDGKFATSSAYILHLIQSDLEQRRAVDEFSTQEVG